MGDTTTHGATSMEKQSVDNEEIDLELISEAESSKKVNCSIDCDAKKIGDKDFEIEIESDDELNLTMKCREEQNSIGLQKGNTYTARNRNRYRYQEGFVAEIDSSEDDIEAKLRIEETEENRGGTWAYYDKKNEEWVTVETTSKNGYLECETDHFSIWTVLVPEIDFTLLSIIGAGIGAAVLAAYCLSGDHESCPVYVLKKEVNKLKTEAQLSIRSESSFRERVEKGLEKIVEIVREMQR